MSYLNILNSAEYHLDQQGLANPFETHEFIYTNNEGEVFKIPAKIPPISKITSPQDTAQIKKGQELLVMMQGEALSVSEYIRLCLVLEPRTNETGVQEIRECLENTSALQLVFSREQLEKFPSDRGLRLELQRVRQIPQTNKRIHLKESFEALPINVSLI